MPLTRFPNGLTVCSTTALKYSASAVDGDVDCNRLFTAGAISAGGSFTGSVLSVTGAITGALGSVYGAKANVCVGGTMTVTLTSALFDSTALLAPYTGYPEIVYLQGATASITRSIRVMGGTDSTGSALATLTIGSATTLAATVYTTIGGTVIAQGSQIEITSAVTATVNTGFLVINFIAVAS